MVKFTVNNIKQDWCFFVAFREVHQHIFCWTVFFVGSHSLLTLFCLAMAMAKHAYISFEIYFRFQVMHFSVVVVLVVVVLFFVYALKVNLVFILFLSHRDRPFDRTLSTLFIALRSVPILHSVCVSNNVIKASIIYIEREIQLMNAALKVKQHRWITIELHWIVRTDIKTNERTKPTGRWETNAKLLNWFLNL